MVKQVTRSFGKRYGLFLIPLTLTGVAVLLWQALCDKGDRLRQREQDELLESVQQRLSRMRDVGLEYVNELARERAREKVRLEQQAANLAGQVQVRILSAMAQHQAMVAAEQARQAQRDRSLLMGLTRKQALRIADLKTELAEAEKAAKEVDPSDGRAPKAVDESGPARAEDVLADISIDVLSELPMSVQEEGVTKKKAALVAGDNPVQDATAPKESPRPTPSLLTQDEDLPFSPPPADETGLAGVKTDWAKEVLLKATPGMKALFGKSASLVIAESDGRAVFEFSALQDRPETKPLIGTASRTLPVSAGGDEQRVWSIRVDVHGEGDLFVPGAAELARRMERHIALDDTARGLVIEPRSRTVEIFPRNAPDLKAMSLPDRGVWTDWLGDGDSPRLTRLEVLTAEPPCPWSYGLQVVIDNSGRHAYALALLNQDLHYSIALLVLVAGWTGGLAFALRNLLGGDLEPVGPTSVPAAREAAVTLRQKPGAREVSENARVILADVGEGDPGKRVCVSEHEDASGRRLSDRYVERSRRRSKPGSLKRLQQQHRGSGASRGCRILDKARSSILRDLAQKVRPREETGTKRTLKPKAAAKVRA